MTGARVKHTLDNSCTCFAPRTSNCSAWPAACFRRVAFSLSGRTRTASIGLRPLGIFGVSKSMSAGLKIAVGLGLNIAGWLLCFLNDFLTGRLRSRIEISISFEGFSLLGVAGLSLLGVLGFSLIGVASFILIGVASFSLTGECPPTGFRTGLDDAELGGLVANVNVSIPCFKDALDGLDLSHGLDALDVRDCFRAGIATSFTVFGGTFGGTSGGVTGDRGDVCTAVVGVVPSAGEKIGDSGLVGLYGAIARTS
jgi:hypothetical protein